MGSILDAIIQGKIQHLLRYIFFSLVSLWTLVWFVSIGAGAEEVRQFGSSLFDILGNSHDLLSQTDKFFDFVRSNELLHGFLILLGAASVFYMTLLALFGKIPANSHGYSLFRGSLEPGTCASGTFLLTILLSFNYLPIFIPILYGFFGILGSLLLGYVFIKTETIEVRPHYIKEAVGDIVRELFTAVMFICMKPLVTFFTPRSENE